jgi:hypothetical protein
MNVFKLFLIGIMGDGVQLGPLGTAATKRPIVLTPGDYDDGEIGGMMNVFKLTAYLITKGRYLRILLKAGHMVRFSHQVP